MEDQLLYFNLRARAEPTRMIYALADQPLTDERISGPDEWLEIKREQPLGQLPVFTCTEGTLVMSNTIARYAAKKFGLMGNTLWEEALNDMIVEACVESFGTFGTRILRWKVLGIEKKPENAEDLVNEIYETLVKTLHFIQQVAELRGAKFLTCDKISLADVWLFSSLEQAQLVYLDILDLNPWMKEFVAKVKSNEKMKNYLEARPNTPV